MKPRIDIDIRDYEGKTAELRDPNTLESFEIYLNDERVITSERVEELEEENEKLRELVRAAWKCIHVGTSCSDCRLIAGGCTLQTAMRELGVETGK